MTTPLSFTRVLAALRRISPTWPSTSDDTSVGKELSTIALGIGMAADPLDTALEEVMPDTTLQLIERWEKACRIPVRPGDDIVVRRARVLSVLRRTSGPRLDQLAKVLATPLDLDVDSVEFIEMLRSYVEEALTESTGIVSLTVPSTGPGAKINLGKPWAGNVDDFGVKVYIAMSAWATTVATLTSPSGTVWEIPATADGWYQNRVDFEGERAGGNWTFTVYDSGAPTLTEFRLLVSNAVDSGQIYNFFVLRDPDVSRTPDLVEAQRLFRRTALAEMRSFVIERLAFIHGDPHSLHGRDPHGVS